MLKLFIIFAIADQVGEKIEKLELYDFKAIFIVILELQKEFIAFCLSEGLCFVVVIGQRG